MAGLQLRGSDLGDVRAVLFDKDGTLSVSEPQLFTLATARVVLCLEQVPRPHRPRLKELLQQAYGLRAGGLDPAGITAVASRHHNLIATATALAQVGIGWPEALVISETAFDQAELDDERLQQTLPPLSGNTPTPPGTSALTKGLDALLRRLREADITCAVISNDTTAGIERFLGSHNIRPYFSAIWSADHRPCKPDPEAVHGLCRQIGVSVEHCALIGDANSDLRMAVAAGIPHRRALGYAAAWSNPPPLVEPHPRIHHWRELEAHPGPSP